MTTFHDPLPRLHVPVRPAHFETPPWYLKRLCAANAVDHDYIQRLVRRRHDATRTPKTPKTARGALGAVIAELGGPEPGHWEASHARATWGMTQSQPLDPFATQRTTRLACTACTGGELVVTYDHIRFGFCVKHGRWLAGGRRSPAQPTGFLDPATLRAERFVRRMVTAGQVDQDHHQTAFEIVRHWAYRSGHTTARFTPDSINPDPDASTGLATRPACDDAVALYPETVRLLATISSTQFAALMRTGRRGADLRRAHLRQRLDWMAREQWVAIGAIEVWATGRQQLLDCTFANSIAA